MSIVYTDKGATFGPCRRYRYALWREWDASKPTVVFCGLNPSTADANYDDATIRREVGFARSWGFGRLVKVNAYAFCSTKPEGLWKAPDPYGPDNVEHLRYWAKKATWFVAAWGNNIRDEQAYKLRLLFIVNRVTVHALKITKQGQPHHPLRLRADTKPFVWLAPDGDG